MGCGISRYDHLHEDDDAHCRPLPPNLNKDHIHPPIVLNNPAAPKDDNARNPLLFNSCTNINNKQPQQILNPGDPNFYLLKHKQPQPQPQIISPSTLTSIRHHDPTMYIQISTIKGNNNNRDHADPKLSISIKRDLGDDKEEEEEEENDQRFSNLDDINASSLLIGSPSFREYCVVRHDSHDFDDDDDDDLFNKYSHNGNKNNTIDDQEIREIKMQREDKIMMMSNHEGSRRKKGDRRRRLKKVFPIIHRRPAPNK